MQRTIFEKLGDFILGRGFYIVLFLCVATIGVSGYYMMDSFTPDEPATITAPVTGKEEVTVPDVAKPPIVVKPQPKPEPKPVPKPQPVVKPAPEPVVKAPAVFTWPMKGEVLVEHSVQTLSYNETMGDWRVHQGIDVAGKVGAEVLAISDGTVKNVLDDELMGKTVVLDHGAGLISVYSNLSAEVVVSKGETVTIGKVIGVVGETAIAESAMDSHLHLEMWQDATVVNPIEYLPER